MTDAKEASPLAGGLKRVILERDGHGRPAKTSGFFGRNMRADFYQFGFRIVSSSQPTQTESTLAQASVNECYENRHLA
jgi:hypothetical protein